MFNRVHIFGFSFVAPNRKRQTKPQLVFTLNKKYWPELMSRLQRLSARWEVGKYLDTSVVFTLPEPDLFGNTEFGYRKCGFLTTKEDEVSLRVELSQEKLFCITATIHLLTDALRVPYEHKSVGSNRSQQIDITTRCSLNSTYGHALSGYVSGEVRNWLRGKGASIDAKNKTARAPFEIVVAMRQAWQAVVSKDSHRWASECGARITNDGRFILDCMGDACDVAIYPDCFEGEGGSVQFSCHNLDQARQQVTLLAGLAKLCELVRRDML